MTHKDQSRILPVPIRIQDRLSFVTITYFDCASSFLALLLLLTMAESLTSFWETYKAEDSFLPLYVPLIIWITTFLYSKARVP
jgi:amino acid permease